jgi:phosphatidylglycerophosphate synthase
MLLFYPIVGCRGAWYFIVLIIAADIFRFFVRGAWYHVPFHRTAWYRNPSKDINASITTGIKIIALMLLAVVRLPSLLVDNLDEGLLGARSFLWYAITIATTIETFRCLLLTMHKHNYHWLGGTFGYIGLPNWLSISRIAASIVMPHIYMTQSVGVASNFIATTIMILAIITDAFDGIVARATHSVTKVGKYLDPLGDKIIFFPNAVAFIWLLYKNSLVTGSKAIIIITAIFLAIAIGRDALFTVWFFTNGRKIPNGIGASFVDKLRMGCVCAWLLAMTLSLSITNDAIRVQMAAMSIFIIAVTAILSVVSVYVDYKRITPKP